VTGNNRGMVINMFEINLKIKFEHPEKYLRKMVSKNLSKQETLRNRLESFSRKRVSCFDKFFETILRYIMNILFQNLVEN